jgi:hypothetical protein
MLIGMGPLSQAMIPSPATSLILLSYLLLSIFSRQQSEWSKEDQHYTNTRVDADIISTYRSLVTESK